MLLVAKTACPAKPWFTRYGAKRGQNGAENVFFTIAQKVITHSTNIEL